MCELQSQLPQNFTSHQNLSPNTTPQSILGTHTEQNHQSTMQELEATQTSSDGEKRHGRESTAPISEQKSSMEKKCSDTRDVETNYRLHSADASQKGRFASLGEKITEQTPELATDAMVDSTDREVWDASESFTSPKTCSRLSTDYAMSMVSQADKGHRHYINTEEVSREKISMDINHRIPTEGQSNEKSSLTFIPKAHGEKESGVRDLKSETSSLRVFHFQPESEVPMSSPQRKVDKKDLKKQQSEEDYSLGGSRVSDLADAPLDLHSVNPLNFGLPNLLHSSLSRVSRETGTASQSSPYPTDVNLPRMFTAAAMAAFSGGISTSSANMEHFGPIFASACSRMYSSESDHYDDPSRKRTMEDPGIPPMRVMYNTSKLLFGGKGHLNSREMGQTPPPPSLSASSTPMTHSPRLTSYEALEAEEDDEMDEDMQSLTPDNHTGMDGQATNGQQWTFEEQFKQLYVLSDDPKRKEFLDELFSYMQRRGTPVNRIPIMAKQVLDLYELFHLVVARGGLVEVINKKLWREITKGLNLPSSITSAAFTLRTQYMKYLYPYECDTLGLSSPNELQAAIDGNRREARRSSYSFDYPMMLGASGVGRNISPTTLIGHPPNAPMTSSMPGTPCISLASTYPSSSTGVTNFPGVPFHFGPNGNFNLPAHFNHLHPLLGLPSSGPTSGLPFQHNVPNSNPANLFPPNLLNHMTLSSGHLPFLSGPNDETNQTKTATSNSSANLLPGISHSFAAAAASLFGTSFAPIPGAFAATEASTTSVTDRSVSPPTPVRGQKNFNSSNLVQRSMGGTIKRNSSDDPKESDSKSTSPLNLTANEDNRRNDITKGSSESKYTEGDQYGVMSSHLKKSFPDDSTAEAQARNSPEKKTYLNQGGKNSELTRTSTVNQHYDLQSHSDGGKEQGDSAEDYLTRKSGAICMNNLGADSLKQPTLWQMNPAIQNGIHSNTEVVPDHKSSPGAGSNSYSKRPSQRALSGQDVPAAKHPRIAGYMDRRAVGGQMKKPESKRFHDTNPWNVVQNQSDVSSPASLSLATQNLKIQTQSGAPMGLPSNAMVVTMELGNTLYQGVLFGQSTRR